MRIRRSRLAADFVQIPNGTVRDSRLSYMARGILADLLSRPDGWEATADELWRLAAEARGSKGEGRRAFRAAFAELKEYGYLVAEREQMPGGKHATVLTAYDVPAGRTDVPHAGTPEEAKGGIAAGRTDVPHVGTSDAADVPHAGTPAPPAQTAIPAGRTDVPLSDVPHAGTSIRRRSTNTEEKTGKRQPRASGLPDPLADLKRGIAAAGLTGVAWDLRESQWEYTRQALDRVGVPAMTAYAVNSARLKGMPAGASAWVNGWRTLEAAPEQDGVAYLPPAVGGLPAPASRQQQETDDWFARAMTRAQARDALENP